VRHHGAAPRTYSVGSYSTRSPLPTCGGQSGHACRVAQRSGLPVTATSSLPRPHCVSFLSKGGSYSRLASSYRVANRLQERYSAEGIRDARRQPAGSSRGRRAASHRSSPRAGSSAQRATPRAAPSVAGAEAPRRARSCTPPTCARPAPARARVGAVRRRVGGCVGELAAEGRVKPISPQWYGRGGHKRDVGWEGRGSHRLNEHAPVLEAGLVRQQHRLRHLLRARRQRPAPRAPRPAPRAAG